MSNNENKFPDSLQKLIEGCSTYFKVSISFWIALAFFSIIIIIPTENDKHLIKLPFNIGEIDKASFYQFTNLVIGILLIAFGSAFCQAIRSRKLIQIAISKISDKYSFGNDIHIQDIVDSMIYPSLSRVAPLAQSLLGKNQFFSKTDKASLGLRRFSTIYYIILKILSIIVIYLFPGYSLLRSFFEGNLYMWDQTLLPILFWVVNLISTLILVQLFFMDVSYIRGVLKRIIHDSN